METSSILNLTAPPLPYCLDSGKTVYEPGDQHPNRQSIGVFDLIVVEQGTLHLGEESQAWSLTAGHSVILLPDRYHYSVKPTEETTVFQWVHFHTIGQWDCSFQEQPVPDHDDYSRQYLTDPYFIQIKQAWRLPYPEQVYQLLGKLNQSGKERHSSAFWTRQQTFEELLRLMDLRQNEGHAGPVVELAEKAEAYLKAHYQSSITSWMMVEALNFHYNYITRCMKQVFGLAPMEYLMKYRLEQAKLLLLKTEWPIGEIALHVGFENIPYFTGCFTKRIGMSPSKYRSRYIK
ncbi:helix-turn-helix transcriptional regulator [Gorillibacterium timonense]|uniref:helix-turn-helix transcriptional regulator n=1 Tax=Gorillibacterium timonense TaxID=1689269 RepID=UPI00071D2ACC|nr:AraC family transcriptional regulator [Gorillibacterium timonense]